MNSSLQCYIYGLNYVLITLPKPDTLSGVYVVSSHPNLLGYYTNVQITNLLSRLYLLNALVPLFI